MNIEEIELRYFKSAYVDKIYRELITNQDHSKYLQDKYDFDEDFVGKTGLKVRFKENLSPLKTDVENSIILYEALKNLTEVQASDERLWAYLVHVHFWDYMKSRWPVDKAEEPINRIKDRFFLRSLNLRTLTRNGLSRLWWYAHLTYKNDEPDPYKYLRILLQRQDLVVGITERALGSSESVRFGILEFLDEKKEIAASQTASRKLITDLSLVGGVKLLPHMGKANIKSLLSTLI